MRVAAILASVSRSVIAKMFHRIYVAGTRPRCTMEEDSLNSESEAVMFNLRLRSAEHVRRYSVALGNPSGWDVKLEEDQAIRRRDHYDDWHRVERAVALFEREVRDLTAHGWSVAPE
jgi:hypothetical protein